MIVDIIAEGLVLIERNSTYYLGISTGVSADTFTASQFDFSTTQKGIIVHDSTITPWDNIEYYQEESQIYIVGPYVNGVTLGELLQYERGAALPYLSRLCRAAIILNENKIRLPIIHTRTILFLRKGGVLFLPHQCIKVINEYQSPANRMQYFEPFNHPDLYKSDAFSFSIATLCYTAFARHVPWEAQDFSTLHSLIKNGIVADIQYHSPEIRSQVNQEILSILSRGKYHKPSLYYWRTIFTQWLIEGVYRDIHPPETTDKIIRKARLLFEMRKKASTRRRLIRSRWSRVLGIVCILIIIIPIPIAVYQGIAGRPEIRRLPPQEVVEQFYLRGFNEGRVNLMKSSIGSEVEFKEIDEIRQLFNRSRARTFFQFRFPLVDPVTWVDKETPSLGRRQSIYGVQILEIVPIAESAQVRTYRLHYRKWIPASLAGGRAANGPHESLVLEREEIISLTKERNAWVITDIDRILSRPLDSDQLEEFR